MKYLKLHNSDDNGVIIVNKDQVTAVVSFIDKQQRLTSKVYLYSSCSIAPFIVNETPSIVIKPEDTEFITLHDAETNNVIVVKKSEISVIDSIKIGTSMKAKVYFSGNNEMQPIFVHESAEKIFNLIEGNV